jgi:hypothetical protein
VDESRSITVAVIGGLIALVGTILTKEMELYPLDWATVGLLSALVFLVIWIVALRYERLTLLGRLGNALDRVRRLETRRVWGFEDIEFKEKTLRKGKESAVCLKRERRSPLVFEKFKVLFSASQPVNFSIRETSFVHWLRGVRGEEWEHALVVDEGKNIQKWTKDYDFNSSLYCMFVAKLPDGVDEAKVSIRLQELVPIAESKLQAKSGEEKEKNPP